MPKLCRVLTTEEAIKNTTATVMKPFLYTPPPSPTLPPPSAFKETMTFEEAKKKKKKKKGGGDLTIQKTVISFIILK